MLCIIPTLMVLLFFFSSRIPQTGNLQTGHYQFVENQKQNQDNTGCFGIKNLPKRLEYLFAETSCFSTIPLAYSSLLIFFSKRSACNFGPSGEPRMISSYFFGVLITG